MLHEAGQVGRSGQREPADRAPVYSGDSGEGPPLMHRDLRRSSVASNANDAREPGYRDECNTCMTQTHGCLRMVKLECLPLLRSMFPKRPPAAAASGSPTS